MTYFNVLNPLDNPIFWNVLIRTLGIFLFAFILVLIINKLTVKNIFKTSIGKRYVSWLFIAPIYLITVLLAGELSILILIIFLIIAIWEFARISNIDRKYIYTLVFMSIYSVIVTTYFTDYFYSLPLFYFLTLTSVAISQNNVEKSYRESAFALFFSIWVIFSLCHFILLGNLNNEIDKEIFGKITKSLMVTIGFAVPLSDIFAYLARIFFRKIKFLDKYKIASQLSPSKTYIGVLGNIFGAFLGILIMQFVLRYYLSFYHWIIIAVIIGVVGIIGDITESMFKRYYKVKNSSQIIPGEAGLLDRIDAVTRVIAALYYYFIFLF